MADFLYGLPKLFDKVNRIDKIRSYIFRRIIEERELISSLYDRMSKICDMPSTDVEYDYIKNRLIEKGFKVDWRLLSTTLLTIYCEREGIGISLGVSPPCLTIDNCIEVYFEGEKIKMVNRKGLEYGWVKKASKLLARMDCNPNKVAEWYIGVLKYISSTLGEIIREMETDPSLSKVKYEYIERIRKLLKDYVIPYYSYVHKIAQGSKEMGNIIWGWLVDRFESLLKYNDGRRRVRIVNLVDSVKIKFLGDEPLLAYILLAPELSNTCITLVNIFTHREDIEWFVKYLEERLPRFPQVLREGKSELRKQVRMIAKIMREYPEIYL